MATGVYHFTYIIRRNGIFAVIFSIDQHTEFNFSRSTETHEGIHGTANASAGIQDIVDEDDVHVLGTEGNVHRTGVQLFIGGSVIVSEEGKIQLAVLDFSMDDVFDFMANDSGRKNTTWLQTNDGGILKI